MATCMAFSMLKTCAIMCTNRTKTPLSSRSLQSGSTTEKGWDVAEGSSKRTVVCMDALEWMMQSENEGLKGGMFVGSVLTSLPDISELQFPQVSEGEKLERYKGWFVDTAAMILNRIPAGQFAIFYQSDVRVCTKEGQVEDWIDKAALCYEASKRTSCKQLWHKYALTCSPGTRSVGRPTLSHIVCFSNGATYKRDRFPAPDVFYRGEMIWPRAIGLDACVLCLAFLRNLGNVSTVIDPFCGRGTTLAVANALGMDAVGVELSPKRCRIATSLSLEEKISGSSRLDPKQRGKHGIPRLLFDTPKKSGSPGRARSSEEEE
ncbi:hypothetical protein GUITHDRAFT_103022 [Guillardia theta CCMP2712]|uniref:DNA methylase N-4/N-6 domain-containing protein n=1 Tax=Guillardia theta (strain CCMP2712) TaxID=905079 RepID=L1JSN9_GUITC|nr:hypothetical protein GUITHDRAFT_103022 [Guillardia theta CCMP2712]EKX51103.1 hypothetical protein GUITHDRAFT_103022 [Guillardia theta CCMP2712]|eukprot:XP_005838083.1 hypothetical protein GUITHDRAFT_103022 [Guillardia theta CCMP2712]